MKKFTFSVLFAIIALSFSANAQIERGNILIGADLANLDIGLNSPNPVTFNITPAAAWFLKDNVALGGYLKFGINSDGSGGQTTYNYGVGLLGRYYAGSDVAVIKHSRFFFEGNGGFGGVNITDGGGNTNGIDLGFGPGFAYFVTPSIGLEALLKYNGIIGFGSTAYRSNLVLNFGFQVYLPGQSTAKKVQSDMNK